MGTRQEETERRVCTPPSVPTGTTLSRVGQLILAGSGHVSLVCPQPHGLEGGGGSRGLGAELGWAPITIVLPPCLLPTNGPQNNRTGSRFIKKCLHQLPYL